MDEQARVAALIEEKTEAEVKQIEAERDWKSLAEAGRNQRKQFDYALSLLDDESRAKVIGFGDAISWLA